MFLGAQRPPSAPPLQDDGYGGFVNKLADDLREEAIESLTEDFSESLSGTVENMTEHVSVTLGEALFQPDPLADESDDFGWDC